MHHGYLALSEYLSKHLNGLAELVIAGFIVFVAGIFLMFGSKIRDAIYTSIVSRAKRQSRLGAPTAAGHLEISGMLNDLRRKFDATRACVFQFHNGDCFMLSNHAWKMSCTHEILHPETVSRLKDNQNLPASALIEVVEPLLNVSSTMPGVRPIAVCDRSHAGCPLNANGHRVLHYTIHQMPMSVSQALANEQGVHHLFVVNLIDPRRGGTTFGFISLQFQALEPTAIERLETSLCDLCSVAEKVQFYLTTDFKTFRTSKVPWWHRLFPD